MHAAEFPVSIPSGRPWSWLLLSIGVGVIPFPASVSADESAAIPDDLVLCVGIDLAAKIDGRPVPILGVSGDALVVEVDGQTRKLPLRGNIMYQARREARIGHTDAVITDLRAEPCFSPRSDPGMQAVRQQSMMTDMSDYSQRTAANAEIRSAAAAVVDPTLPSDLGQIVQRTQQSRVSELNSQPMQTRERPGVDPSSVDMSGSKEAGRTPYDALAVTFRIATRAEHKDAYLVLFSDVIAPNNPNAPVTVVMVKKLPRLGPKPRKVSLQQLGLPHGYGLVNYRIHVFSSDGELLTNLAERRTEVTKDEAFQFLLWRHLNENRKRTLPPEPIVDLLPRDFAPIAAAATPERKVAVALDEEGRVTNLKLDRAGSTDADAYIEATIRELPFLPALENGRPVAAETAIVVADLVR